MNAILLKRNHIHIAFDHQPFLGFLFAALIEAIQQLVFMEDFRIWRVDVFRLDLVIQGTAAKADHTALGITDRENDSFTQQVKITATVAGANQT